MRKTIFLITGFFLSFSAFAQHHDHHWMMGYGDTEQDSLFGTSRINFSTDPPTVYLKDSDLNFDGCNGSMSTPDGELLFYSNCIELYNAVDEPLLNSEDFNYNLFHEEFGYEETGLPLIQGILPLQAIEDENIYYVFHLKLDYEFVDQDNFFFYTKGLYYTIIDTNGDNGNGMVIEKGIPIVEDTLTMGGLTATRHANGRDWWLLIGELNNNNFYRILLDHDGVHLIGNQDLSTFTHTEFGQATFSPDGSWFIRNNLIGNTDVDDYLDFYRFDRCTGILSEHKRFAYGDGFIAGGGAVISPDSRFLYVGHHLYVYQYDLESDDIQASVDTVAIWDGFVDGILATTFFLGQNAPDGKIYFNCSNGVSYLHTINNPNGQGAACRFDQHSVDLPTYNAFSLPNFPNYRLGPIDGSPCDTLDIDNLPLAAFNYYADSSDYLTIHFWDYSYYEPTEWSWSFGDSDEGEGQTPVHTYTEPGIYEVCLTASNDYGSDSICKWLEFSPVGIKEILPEQDVVLLYPNPASEEVTIRFQEALTAPLRFKLFNALGQEVLTQSITAGSLKVHFDLRDLQPGIYFYTLENSGKEVSSGKLVIER